MLKYSVTTIKIRYFEVFTNKVQRVWKLWFLLCRKCVFSNILIPTKTSNFKNQTKIFPTKFGVWALDRLSFPIPIFTPKSVRYRSKISKVIADAYYSSKHVLFVHAFFYFRHFGFTIPIFCSISKQIEYNDKFNGQIVLLLVVVGIVLNKSNEAWQKHRC